MIARLKKFCRASRDRYRMLKEARALLRALELPSGSAPDLEVLTILMNLGLGHLRAYKIQQDAARAARQMDALIKDPATPRPSVEEAQSN
jgi:hypothetical protein